MAKQKRKTSLTAYYSKSFRLNLKHGDCSAAARNLATIILRSSARSSAPAKLEKQFNAKCRYSFPDYLGSEHILGR